MKLEVDNRYLEDIPLRILAQQSVGFSGKLYSPEHEQKFSTEHSEAKLERDPENAHRFILKIDGVSVFQGFRDMARKLLEKLASDNPNPDSATESADDWKFQVLE